MQAAGAGAAFAGIRPDEGWGGAVRNNIEGERIRESGVAAGVGHANLKRGLSARGDAGGDGTELEWERGIHANNYAVLEQLD